MVFEGIIEPIEESDWVSPMVVKDNKTKGGIRIYLDLHKLNDTCMHDPFPNPFSDEILNNVGGHESYPFTNGFSGYHQIRIVPEDQSKNTFATESRSFQYIVMPFGLKNSLDIFLHVVVIYFKEFIHKFFEAYFDDCTIFGLLNKHV